VAKAVKEMDAGAIQAYETSGSITLAGQALVAGDIKVLRDFRVPDGASADDVDANGDGEVLAVLDLRLDSSLVEVGGWRAGVPVVWTLDFWAAWVGRDAGPVAGQQPGGVGWPKGYGLHSAACGMLPVMCWLCTGAAAGAHPACWQALGLASTSSGL
jgi:hypothetical protein